MSTTPNGCREIPSCEPSSIERVLSDQPLFAEGKVTRREFIKTSRALEKAADHQLAVLWAMDDDQLKQHLEILADFQKSKSTAKLASI